MKLKHRLSTSIYEIEELCNGALQINNRNKKLLMCHIALLVSADFTI